MPSSVSLNTFLTLILLSWSFFCSMSGSDGIYSTPRHSPLERAVLLQCLAVLAHGSFVMSWLLCHAVCSKPGPGPVIIDEPGMCREGPEFKLRAPDTTVSNPDFTKEQDNPWGTTLHWRRGSMRWKHSETMNHSLCDDLGRGRAAAESDNWTSLLASG